MNLTKEIVQFVFSAALFINALLFIPQAIKIVKEKTTKDVSLTTFLGFLLIQLAIVFHGIIVQDYLLIFGYAASMITCGTVVALILFYGKKEAGNCEITAAEILERLPGHVYWKDKNCVLLGCNTNNWRDFGQKSLADFVGKTDYDLFSKEEADQLRVIDEEVMRTDKIKVIEEHVTSITGKTIYLTHKIPLKNRKNQIMGVLGISMDVTEKSKETITKLETLEKIIAVMPGNVYWLDKFGTYQGCNDNQAQLIGLRSRKEIVGKRNIEIPGFLIPTVLDKHNETVITTGKKLSVEEPAILPNGEDAIFLSNKVPLFNDDNEVIGMVGISLDITERKEHEEAIRKAKEEAEKSSQAKADFISNMEHDIRTPFVGIYGTLNILAQQEPDQEKKSILEEVSTCAKELMDYCNDILDFSKIEAEAFPIVSKNFDLREVIDSSMKIESVVAKNKKLDLSLDFDQKLPRIIIGDPYRLQRMLLNLVSNAIKFTAQGYVKVTVILAHKDQAGRNIVIKFIIEDSGMGIAEDKKALIYEKFMKGSPSNKGLYKGLGLGLKIVKQFITELEGDIELRSTVDQGSTFTVSLPFKVPLVNTEFKRSEDVSTQQV